MKLPNVMSPLTERNPLAWDHRILREASPEISVFETAGERLFVVHPAAKVRAEILFVHGLSDHPGRHFHTATKLARRGFRVTLFELAGHGGRGQPLERTWPIYRAYAKHEEPSRIQTILSGKEIPLGKRAFNSIQFQMLRRFRMSHHIHQTERILNTRWVGQAPQHPLFIVGFSMGALIAAETILRNKRRNLTNLDFRGASFLSPAFRPQGQPGNPLQNLLVDSLWVMRKTPLPFPRLVVKTAMELNFPLDASWGIPYMSDLPAEVELYGSDPLIPTIFPSAYLSSIETQMANTFDKAQRFPADALFLVPEEDGITSVGGRLAFAKQVRKSLGRDRCSVVRFESVAAHDLTRSSVGEQTFESLLSWLRERVS